MSLKSVLNSVFIAALLLFPLLGRSELTPSAPRRIEVTAKRFQYLPGEITLKKGEPVVLVIRSADVAHGIRFKELGIETNVGKGQTSELAFTPERTGTFIGHCSVFCGSGHGSMTLTLHIVE
jgi:cytochrome c oxidase subunit II